MACVLEFESSAIDVQDHGVSDRVDIRFATAPGSDDYVSIGFNRWNLAFLFGQILEATRSGSLPPPEPQHFDSLIVIEGHATQKLPDGGVELTFHLRTDDGMRSMVIPMTADYARSLARELTAWLD